VVRMFLRAGVCGFVVKTANTTVLFDAIRAVHHGSRYLDPLLSDVVVEVIESGAEMVRNVVLTAREKQVLQLIARGKTYKEIAAALNVSVKTVETYRTRLGEKTQLRSRKALSDFAGKHESTTKE
jgi:two-component system, NarL family, response regulator NreC